MLVFLSPIFVANEIVTCDLFVAISLFFLTDCEWKNQFNKNFLDQKQKLSRFIVYRN